MKGEYINSFIAFSNPATNEVVILLKQDTENPYFEIDENGNRQIKMGETESVEMYKAILPVKNAKQLAEVLTKCIEQAEKQRQEIAKNE